MKEIQHKVIAKLLSEFPGFEGPLEMDPLQRVFFKDKGDERHTIGWPYIYESKDSVTKEVLTKLLNIEVR